MSKFLDGKNCPNMPWEDKPDGYELPVWRYSKNPITKRPYSKTIDRVMNSSIVPFNGEFIGVFRCDNHSNRSALYVGHSKDGVNIVMEDEPIKILDSEGNIVSPWGKFDPRIAKIGEEYYVTFCDYCIDEVTTAIAKTKDFKTFYRFDNPFTPNYRNGVFFPRKFGDFYKILLRPCDAGNSNFGNIYVTQSKDMEYFGKSKMVAHAGFSGWNWTKIGPGPTPIEIDEGWLIIIHGVINTCAGYIYSMGAIIVDHDDPSKVLYKCEPALLWPTMQYETTGFTNNVVFPTAVLTDAKTGRMAIYYGAADAYTSLAFTTIDELVDYIKKNSK